MLTNALHPRPPVALMEPMEPRLLLAGGLVISEFMADNTHTLQDKDGAYSDWLEIFNGGTTDVNLNGWYLTDSATNLNKWRFPSTPLSAGAYLLVFASGKNIAVAGQELHTSFKLGAGGDYLALVEPDSHTIAYAYSPQYPAQYADISYGIGQDIVTKTLVGPTNPLCAMVPTNGSLGLGWTAWDYNDSAWPLRGTGGAGFEAGMPGLAVHTYLANFAVGSLGQAEDVISDPAKRRVATVYGENAPVINYLNTGGDGHFTGGRNVPGVSPAYAYTQNFVMEATGWVTVPAAGNYTFGVSSDDGFGLTIAGATTTWVSNSSTPAGTDRIDYTGSRTAADTFGTFSFPASGKYLVRLVWFQATSGAEIEMFACAGNYRAFNYSDYKLVGDTAGGGLAAEGLSAAFVPSYAPLIGTDVRTAMFKVSPSIYARFPFNIADQSQLDSYNSLTLRIRYDDGFVAYVNGAEVARRKAPTDIAWDSAATGEHPRANALNYEEIDLTAYLPLLRVGANVLAIQGLNVNKDDLDFLIQAELVDIDVISTGVHYFATPTPLGRNSTDYYARVEDLTFDHTHGFYDGPFDVTITTATPGASIRYTMDSSPPTETTGILYTGPVRISRTTVLRTAAFKTGYDPCTVDTRTFIFLGDVVNQPANPAGFPSTWNGFGADYEVDPNVVNVAPYSSTIKDDLRSIPTMSIVTKVDDMFGPAGIYSNPMTNNLEVPGSFEYILPDGSKGFQVNCGVGIYGGWGRHVEYRKHSFRVYFREEYGPGKLNYDLFGGDAVTSFNSLVLRSNFNDFYVGYGGNAQFLRDSWTRDTQLALSGMGSRGTFVHLFVDGLYWGLYNLSERPDEDFSASYFGGDPDEYDAFHMHWMPTGQLLQVLNGDRIVFDQIFNLANTGYLQSGHAYDPNALASDANYQAIQQYLDVDALIDYVLTNFYGNNWDWDWNNWYASRRRAPDGRLRFYCWDGEGNLDPGSLGGNITSRNTDWGPTRLFQQLRANADFRQLLSDHIYKAYFNGGPLSVEGSKAIYQNLADTIKSAVAGESARWGDMWWEPPLTRDGNWVPARDWLLNTWFPQRSGIELGNLRGAGMYPALAAGAEAPLFSQNGGSIPVGFELTITNPNAGGTIYYTLDGSDPRLPGGEISPTALTGGASASATLGDSTIVRARVRNGTVWSALHEAVFLVPDPPPLRITELMYHAADPPQGSPYTADDFEFIEVRNIGADPRFVGGVHFGDGVQFTFPNVTVPAGGYGVIVSNRPAFESRYGTGISILGQYAGNLNDGGERIVLESRFSEVILDFHYRADWYSAPNGEGFSLGIVDPLADRASWDDKDSWWPSLNVGGSPGADNVTMAPHSVVINELLSHTDADPRGDWVELRNLTDHPIDIGGWYLSNSAGDLKKYRIASGTVLQPAGEPGSLCLITRTDNFGNPADPGYRTYFSFSEYGGTVYLSAGDAGGNILGYRETQDFGAADREVAFARYVKSTGKTDFVAESVNTPNAENAPPKIGPVVINEVMYHPLNDTDEFIELWNITGLTVPLYDPANPIRTWKFMGDLDYAFPLNTSIPAGGYLLLVNSDPASFRARYGVPAGVSILGPVSILGRVLNNAGENVKLYKPGAPDPQPPYEVPYYLVDRVEYKDVAPWPTTPDGLGPSLQRISITQYGNDAVNWYPGPPEGTPGFPNGDVDVTPPRIVDARTNDGVPAQVIVVFNDPMDAVASRVAANYTIIGLPVYSVAAGPDDRTVVLTTGVMKTGTTYTLTVNHVRNAAGVEMTVPDSIMFSYYETGIGLLGQYYQYPPGNINWANLKMSRVDPTVSFDWGTGTPDSLLMADQFSVRWTGKIASVYSETYTFYAASEDGVRVWINNQLVIDDWVKHAAHEVSGTFAMVAGQKYDVKIEYYEDTGAASMKFSWSSPSTSKQIVPTSQLFSAVTPPVSVGDSYTLVWNAAFSVNASQGVLKNDSDPNNQPLTAVIVRRTAHGSLVFLLNGSFTYTPNAGYSGTDYFIYKANNGQADGNPVTVNLYVDSPPCVTAITVNGNAGQGVSSIDPSTGGLTTIAVTFSKVITYTDEDVLVQKVTFEGNTETVTDTLMPDMFGAGSNTMTITFPSGPVRDTWLKVRLRGNWTLKGISGLLLTLDGEPKAGGSGRTYLYDASKDLPSGNGTAGGDVIFYIGSLRGDYSRDGLILQDDLDTFRAKYAAHDPLADFRGTGFAADEPDGLFTPADLDAFLAAYNMAAAGRHLPPLPNPGPLAAAGAEPLAAGSPTPLPSVPDGLDGTAGVDLMSLATGSEVVRADTALDAAAQVEPSDADAAALSLGPVAGAAADAGWTLAVEAQAAVPLAWGDAEGVAPPESCPALATDGPTMDLLALPPLPL